LIIDKQMKTKYKVSEMGLQKPEGVVIGLRWANGTEFESTLEGLPKVVREHGLRNQMPVRVTINGRKGGAFPCLIALSEVSAAFISGRVGYKVEKDDGVSFATQGAAAKLYADILDLGASPQEMSFEWRVGPKTEPIAPKQYVLPFPQDDQPPF
jgi:hypothetical protein